jgi:acrylyl-CoA reductase (NADPH)
MRYSMMFKAIYLTQTDDGKTQAALHEFNEDILPRHESGNVIVNIHYSTINYKDGLAITGRSPVVRSFPMVPGIDLCGVVAESEDPEWKAGDNVIVNGWEIGERHWGGLSQRARVRSDWLIRLPAGLTPWDAMAIGTAGYTAMLCVRGLEKNGVSPDSGPVLVTGASGGVGSIAVSILAKLGYKVTASTGRLSESDYLRELGAADIIDRSSLSSPGKPLQKERWAGVVDSVGSHTLANACASTLYGGTVTACGLAQGMDLPLTVAPFILRGVKLIGINSVLISRAEREDAWERLAKDLKPQAIAAMARTVALPEVFDVARDILDGKIRGRVVVDVQKTN